jgi:hypothetical protein
MMRNYPVEVGPETIDVGGAKTFYPFRILSVPVVASLSGDRAIFARFEVRCLFRIFTYGFHRIVRVGPRSSGSFVTENLGG